MKKAFVRNLRGRPGTDVAVKVVGGPEPRIRLHSTTSCWFANCWFDADGLRELISALQQAEEDFRLNFACGARDFDDNDNTDTTGDGE
ncbi:hypothetical protein I6B53_03365 [Schaalia sp. 19OD2882]|uniref:hypothetical protein n=1 Tax=Schaalia sp. 19OD2882 TaxID=2794089 RepID=UPI001C1EF907|nr:hypothetical protein [Schaalia sp. 19OD2882]QWW20150.1 hypothetical protein I6B53_03365 [Schaalia sp. 19OD2882]